MKKVNNSKQLDSNKLLVTYIDKLDNEVIKSHNLNIVKLYNSVKDKEFMTRDFTSIVISAAVTAYAIIFMSKLKLDLLNRMGNIYYSDTDSIVCDIELNDNYVHPNFIGLLKLEHTIKKEIFISGKTNCLIIKENKIIKKTKGLNSKSSEDNFTNTSSTTVSEYFDDLPINTISRTRTGNNRMVDELFTD